MLHRARGLLVRQRTMLVNALRAHMAEFGIIAPQGLRHVEALKDETAREQARPPELARPILQLCELLDRRVLAERELCKPDAALPTSRPLDEHL